MILKFIAALVSMFFSQNLYAKECSIDSPFNTIQVKGSHNSYHQRPSIPLSLGWNYSHPPLQKQFSEHKIRQIEFDLHWDQENELINVFHIPIIDLRSSCKTLGSCFKQMISWSKNHRFHDPIMVLLDIKNSIREKERAFAYLSLIEQQIKDYFPVQNIYTPDELKGTFKNLHTAVTTRGWPSYRSMKGKFLFVLHTKGLLRSVYNMQEPKLDTKLMFSESDGLSSYSAIIIKNDPVQQFDVIKQLVEKGFIVRTRADAGLKHSPLRIEKAIKSGAQIITTDFLLGSSRGFFDLAGLNALKCNFLSN
ncbi:MAG: Ca2+-dependent phosphoinositide-specific phospholipase C [Oligoflexales bacterium]